MTLEDWDIDICSHGQDKFWFYEDGYTLCVVTDHDYDNAYNDLSWQVDDYYLVSENDTILTDNAGMSEELFKAYDLDITSAIDEKLKEYFK